jgi:AraC-like DNA-binding protein
MNVNQPKSSVNKFCFYFCEIDSEQTFKELAQSLGGKYHNEAIHFLANDVSGIIRKIRFEEGFHIRVWNIKVNKPVVLSKLACPVSFAGKTFHIGYILSRDELIVRHKRIESPFEMRPAMNNFFFSSDSAIELEIPAGSNFQAIDISVSSSWIMNAFRDAEPAFLTFLTQLEKSLNPVTSFETSSSAEFRTATNLHVTLLSEPKGILHIKAGTLSLLADFFNKIYSKLSKQVQENKVLHHDKMIEVEKMLVAHLQQTLPCIEDIAHNVALSQSTLKRHFKMMFGRSIYEYYLAMKMDLAKRILLEKPLSVNEVAAMLNYEKVSNFIDMFKKRHGYSPGSMRKRHMPE